MVVPYDVSDTRNVPFYVIVYAVDGSSYNVYYGGSGTLESVSWDFEADRVPSATFRVRNPPPATIGYRSRVEIAVQSLAWVVFRGVILDIARDEEGFTCECVGRSWSLDVPYQTALGIFQSPITNQQAVLNMLGNAGLTAISTVNLVSWTLATNSSQILQFGTWGDAIKKVIEPDDAHWWEDRNGFVHVSYLALVPAAVPVRTYFAQRDITGQGLVETYPPGIAAPYRPRIRSGVNTTDVRSTKNRIIVRGYSVNTINADGTTTSAPLEKTVSAPSPYVVKPDGTQDYSDFVYSNELMDTQAKVDEVADRYISKLNRLHVRLTVEIDGDPRVSLGETVEIVDYDYTGIVGNFVVVRYTTSMDSGDFVTILELEGGVVAPNQDPIAAFTYRVEREVMTDRVYAFVTFDARASYDLDGTIASYAWSDNQATDIATGTEAVFTVRVDPSTLTVPWEVTLVVTDDSGNTGTFTVEVDIDADGEFTFVPAITTAFDTRYSATPDGGQTWYDQVGTSVISTAAGNLSLAPGIAIYGTTAGGIWRTTDYCFTAPTQVMSNVGSPIIDLEWDRYVPARCWGITQDGRVFRSDNEGVTWNLWDDLRLIYLSTNIRLNRVHSTPGGVRVYGALNGDPLIARDVGNSHTWRQAALGGELLEDLNAGAPSNIYIADAAWNDPAELAIILANTGTASGGLSFAEGSYVGDGGTQAITNKGALGAGGPIGFTPKLVVVKAITAPTGNLHAMMRTSTMGTSRNMVNATTNGGIASLDAGGFTVTHLVVANGRTNEVGKTYEWWAIGGTNVDAGTYTSTGVDNLAVTTVPFAPVFVLVTDTLGTSTDVPYRTTSMGANALDFDVDSGSADTIKSLTSNGFTLGTSVKVNTGVAQTYHYLAIAASTNFAEGTYVGNDVIGRSIPVPFDPGLANVKSEAGQEARFRITSMGGGDTSFGYQNTTTVTNRIMSLTTAAFTVGNDADTNNDPPGPTTITYFWFAIGASSTGTPNPAVYYNIDVDGDGDDWTRAIGQPAESNGRWIAEDLEQDKFVFAYDDTAIYRGDVSGGVMAVTQAPTFLDSGDAPNHGLFVGQRVIGMAGVYIVSAEGTADGTLYKTFDRFATIGKFRPATSFPASPAGANGKMCDLGATLAPQQLNLLAQQSSLTSSSVPDTYPRRVARLSGGTWSIISNPASAVQRSITWLRRFGDNLYRLGAHRTFGLPFFNVGSLERSADGGITWAATGPAMAEAGPSLSDDRTGVCDVDIAADGTLWLVYTPNGTASLHNWGSNAKIYKSVDDGVNWTLVYEQTVQIGPSQDMMVSVTCHPSNPNIIAVLGTEQTPPWPIGWFTYDGGGTWTDIEFGALSSGPPDCRGGQDSAVRRDWIMFNNGAIVAANDGNDFWRIDDPASGNYCFYEVSANTFSWTYMHHFIRTPTDILFAVGGGALDSDVARSFDAGNTWEIIFSQSNAGGSFGYNIMGLHYDASADALYCSSLSEQTSDRVFRIADATKPVVGDVTDLTLNLDSLFTAAGSGEQYVGAQGITQ